MLETSIERRAELVSQAKTGKLSVAEVDELKSLLEKELRHDIAAGKIGVLAFIMLLALIRNLEWCLGSYGNKLS
ncbi:unnamed protein product [marine sediment metagenome]|uniref:Uncharacterized protein n=1 Tax=marine sediment metagenome TaxID=412755 RepID=X1UZ66_9ZZZZ